MLAALDHDVSRRGAWLAYLGSGEHGVRLRVLGPDRIAPGATGLVRVHLPAPLPLRIGDRFVLRESGRQETVGGGTVLDVDPVLPASKARPTGERDQLVRERGWVEAEVLERYLAEPVAPTVGRWVVDPGALAAAAADLRARVEGAGDLGLDVAALDERARAVLPMVDGVTVVSGRARSGDGRDPLAGHPYLAALEAAPFAPPSPEEAGVDRGELRELVRRGLVVERDGHHFSPAAVEAAAVVMAQLLARRPEGVTAGEVRDALGTTRKHAMPLLALLDAGGVTRRRGDLRIGGPRLPSV